MESWRVAHAPWKLLWRGVLPLAAMGWTNNARVHEWEVHCRKTTHF
jgi:hypothetical protein